MALKSCICVARISAAGLQMSSGDPDEMHMRVCMNQICVAKILAAEPNFSRTDLISSLQDLFRD